MLSWQKWDQVDNRDSVVMRMQTEKKAKDKAEKKAKRAAEREANRQRLEVYTEGVAMSCTAVQSRY